MSSYKQKSALGRPAREGKRALTGGSAAGATYLWVKDMSVDAQKVTLSVGKCSPFCVHHLKFDTKLYVPSTTEQAVNEFEIVDRG